MNKNDGRVVSNFICQALENKPLTIYGDGNQTRSFCYVDDLIEGILRMMDSPDTFIGPVNLGNPAEFTMIQLANLVLDLIPESTSDIVFKELPIDDPQQRRPNIGMAHIGLGWKPNISLIKGLVLTINYFRQQLTEDK